MLDWLESLPDVEKTDLLDDRAEAHALLERSKRTAEKAVQTQLMSKAYLLALKIESQAKEHFGCALVEQAKQVA